jgi:hypothetical protein
MIRRFKLEQTIQKDKQNVIYKQVTKPKASSRILVNSK